MFRFLTRSTDSRIEKLNFKDLRILIDLSISVNVHPQLIPLLNPKMNPLSLQIYQKLL